MTNIPHPGPFPESFLFGVATAAYQGYDMRFGLVHVDYQTQQRTVKDSGNWYSQLSADHRNSR